MNDPCDHYEKVIYEGKLVRIDNKHELGKGVVIDKEDKEFFIHCKEAGGYPLNLHPLSLLLIDKSNKRLGKRKESYEN